MVACNIIIVTMTTTRHKITSLRHRVTALRLNISSKQAFHIGAMSLVGAGLGLLTRMAGMTMIPGITMIPGMISQEHMILTLGLVIRTATTTTTVRGVKAPRTRVKALGTRVPGARVKAITATIEHVALQSRSCVIQLSDQKRVAKLVFWYVPTSKFLFEICFP
jgi:hypothetical protein